MKITRELNEFLKMFLKMEGKDAVNISLVPHKCGGKGLDIKCVKLENEEYKDIDGLKIIISNDDEELLEHYILDADDNGGVRVMLDNNSAHQCNCGCGGDCSCNNDHDHSCSCGEECSCHSNK